MIELIEPLSEEKLAQFKSDIERLKKLPTNFNRAFDIKALEKLIEAHQKVLTKVKK